VLLVYAAGVLLLAEGFSRAVFAWPPVFRRLARRDEVAWRLEWVRRHRDAPAPSFPFDAWHPTRGWALRPGLRDLPVFSGKVLSSNSAGVRGSREFEATRPAGTRRLVLLGDSFTFGEGVSDVETYAAQLSLLLPRLEILNLAVHGYGHDQMLLALKEEGLRYRPDLVVLGFVFEDVDRNVLAFRDFAKPRFRLAGGKLRIAGTQVPAPQQVLAREIWRPRLMDFLEALYHGYRWKTGATRREAEAITRAILTEIAGSARKAGAVPLFVYLPVDTEILESGREPTPGETYLFSVCRAARVRCFSVRPYLAAHLVPGSFPVRAPHWSPPVHRAAAEAIRDYLAAGGLAPH
jgi:hypothetical protein